MNHLFKAFWLYLLLAHGGIILIADNLQDLHQRIDSLEEAGQTAQMFATYRTMFRSYYDAQKIDEAISVGKEGLEKSRTYKDSLAQFWFNQSLGGVFYFPKDDYEEAIRYFLQAESCYSQGVSPRQWAANYCYLAEANVSLGKFNEALGYQLKAQELMASVNDTAMLADGYFMLGSIYSSKEDYAAALENFLEGLNIADHFQLDPFLHNALLVSACESYLEMDRPKQAVIYLEESKPFVDSLKHPYVSAYYLGAWGRICLKNHENHDAVDYLEKAKQSFFQQNIKREWALFSISLSKAYIVLGKAQKSLALLDSVEVVAHEINSLELLRDATKSRSEAYAALGDKANAYEQLQHYLHLKDSLLSDDEKVELTRLESRFKLQKRDETIESLKEEFAINQRQMILIGLGAGFFVLLILLWMGLQRNRALNQINLLLNQKNQEIHTQNERLASSNEELRQFAHVTSHDLREPLRSIGGFATLLGRRYKTALDEQGKEYLTYIKGGVQRMDALLTDLLTYSTVGILEQDFDAVSVQEVIQEILYRYHKEDRAQGVRISIQNLPTITADARQMKMLFGHLIDNAIKFRSDANPEIQVNCEKINGFYHFSVRDNGIGMDEAYKEKIFHLFLRLHNGDSGYEGSGIGLSICRKIVQQHRGRIWIESQKGTGTTVHFSLPESPLNQSEGINWRNENYYEDLKQY